MERESLSSSGPPPPGAATEQLQAARRTHDASVRRPTVPLGLILALSVFCGAQSVAPVHGGPRNAVTIASLVWAVAEIVRMAARNHWRPLRSWPKPRWSVVEVTLIGVAVLVGAVLGPHVFAGHDGSALAGWGLGAAVTVTVGACLLAATASYRRRVSRAWRRCRPAAISAVRT